MNAAKKIDLGSQKASVSDETGIQEQGAAAAPDGESSVQRFHNSEVQGASQETANQEIHVDRAQASANNDALEAPASGSKAALGEEMEIKLSSQAAIAEESSSGLQVASGSEAGGQASHAAADPAAVVSDPATAISLELVELQSLSLQKNPLQVFGLLCFVGSLLLFLKACYVDAVPNEKWLQVQEQHDELTTTYDREVDKLIEQLDTIAADTTVLAELSFQEKQRDFVKQVERFGRNAKGDFSDIIRDPTLTRLNQQFRSFLTTWLRISAQVSLDPINAPWTLVSETALRRASTIEEIAITFLERAKATPPSLLGEDISSTSNLRQLLKGDNEQSRSSREGSGYQRCCFCCCRWLKWSCGLGVEWNPDEKQDGRAFPVHVWLLVIRITFFSSSHIWAILWLLVDIVAVVMLVIAQKYVVSAGAGVGALLLLVLLYQEDERDLQHLLSKRVRHLKEQATAVAQRRQNVLTAYRKMQDLTLLWRYSTLPRMENYLAVCEMIQESDRKHIQEIFGAVVERVERMNKTMGDLSLWIGEDALPEASLKMVAEQVDAVTQVIIQNCSKKKAIPNIMHHIGHAIGFLQIRIRACYNLPAVTRKTAAGVYVLILVGRGDGDDGAQFRTTAVADIHNPMWRQSNGKYYEEFFTPVTPDTRSLTMQVMGETDESKKAARFGFMTANFRQIEPGKWHTFRELLFDVKTHKQQHQAAMEFDLFCATSVEHLDTIEKGRVVSLDNFLT